MEGETMSRYRTPLRYPGGKQRLTPFILEVLANNGLTGGHYAEPYAGGAGVAMELLLERHVSHVHLNDSSRAIYAFWNSILTQPEEFCRRISSASLTVDEWKKCREVVRYPDVIDELDLGFSVFYLNRCNRSGVLSGGIIGGLDQTGPWKMDARFPRNELIRRIEAIAIRADSITLRNWDAERFIIEHIPTLPHETFVYCDPPYFEKASKLYLNHYKPGDHARVAEVIQEQLPRRWAVSYDNAIEILNYYSERQSFLYDLQYSAAKVYKGKEVFIFSDDVQIPLRSSLPYINFSLQERNETTRQLEFEAMEIQKMRHRSL
jgi:DNA adenine methylase